MEIPWNFHGNSIDKKWKFHGISMEIPFNIPWKFHRVCFSGL